MVGTCDPEIDGIYVPCPPQNVPQVSVVTLCERPTFIIKQYTGEQQIDANRWLCST